MALGDPSWFSALLPASFRGIPFNVTQHTRDGGIRGPDNELPGRDEGVLQELGNKIDRFTFDAYLVGDTYHLQAQDLIVALKSGGGLLIHPRWGERQVVPRSWSSVESVSDQGIARIQLSFSEDLAEAGVIWFEADDALVDEATDELLLVASDEFVAAYSIAGEPGFVIEQAGRDLLSRVTQFRVALATPIAGPPGDPQLVEASLAALGALADQPVGLAAPGAPLTVADHVADLVTGIGDYGALLAFSRLRRPVRISDGVDPPEHPSEATGAANEDAMSGLVHRMALGELARAAKDTQWISNNEALAARDEVIGLISTEENTPIDRLVYVELSGAKLALYGWLTGFAENLATLRDIEVEHVTSALELAWDLYGDAERAEEIMDRNGIVHGGFVSPGTLTVLSE